LTHSGNLFFQVPVFRISSRTSFIFSAINMVSVIWWLSGGKSIRGNLSVHHLKSQRGNTIIEWYSQAS